MLTVMVAEVAGPADAGNAIVDPGVGELPNTGPVGVQVIEMVIDGRVRSLVASTSVSVMTMVAPGDGMQVIVTPIPPDAATAAGKPL